MEDAKIKKSAKLDRIDILLHDVKYKSKQHYKQYKKLRRFSNVLKIASNVLNTISVSSLVLMLSPISPVFIGVALVSTSISGVLSMILLSSNCDNKSSHHNTSSQQYRDLHRNIKQIILKNHLSNADLDALIIEINTSLSLIEDSSEII